MRFRPAWEGPANSGGSTTGSWCRTSCAWASPSAAESCRSRRSFRLRNLGSLIPNPIIHSTTFGGNPIACAAGIAAIDVTLEEDLPGQAAAKGELLLRELGVLQRKYPSVLRGVRGKGLLIGLEFPPTRSATSAPARCSGAGCWSRARIRRREPFGSNRPWIPTELLRELLNRLEDSFKEISPQVRPQSVACNALAEV